MADITVPNLEQLTAPDGKLTREGAQFWTRVLQVLNRFNTQVLTGTGSPAGVVIADRGTLFLRSDGGAGTTLYVKEGNDSTVNGWVAK